MTEEAKDAATPEEYDAERLASRIEMFTNRFGVREDLKNLALKTACMHRTLVQSFTSGFILQFVKKMAENCREGRFDGRNKQAAVVCEAMWAAVEGKYGLDKGEDIALPMI